MIVTVTPNPSLDRTMAVDTLVRGAVLRAASAVVEPSGKGVNVSRALAVNGHRTLAVFPAGGAEGAQLLSLLAVEQLPHRAVSVVDSVRVNVSVLEPDGTVTKINEPGLTLSTVECEALVATALDAAAEADVLVASGSLPPGAPPDLYADLVRKSAVPVVVDTSGAALKAVVPARPALVKPNLDELSELVGRWLPTIGDVVVAADEIRYAGVEAVLVSIGRDGALLVDDRGAVHGEVIVERPRNTVGAGDALLAGFLTGGGLGEALAYAAAAVLHVGTNTPVVTAEHRAAVRLHHGVDLARPLTQ